MSRNVSTAPLWHLFRYLFLNLLTHIFLAAIHLLILVRLILLLPDPVLDLISFLSPLILFLFPLRLDLNHVH